VQDTATTEVVEVEATEGVVVAITVTITTIRMAASKRNLAPMDSSASSCTQRMVAKMSTVKMRSSSLNRYLQTESSIRKRRWLLSLVKAKFSCLGSIGFRCILLKLQILIMMNYMKLKSKN
jgi:hypothetical protein